jgi:hypothetical protein
MHRLAAGHRVLDVGPRFYAWAQRERLNVAFGEDSRAEGGAEPGFITPRDGDEFLVERGIPLVSQTIPVRIRGPATIRLRVDGAAVALDPTRSTRLALAGGAHQLELWKPGGAGPTTIVRIQVRGGEPAPARSN